MGFTADGYVIHLGRGSLAAVAANEERMNPLYAWARDHHEPHFGNVPGAIEQYRDLVAAFRGEVGSVTANSLIASCLRQASYGQHRRVSSRRQRGYRP